MRIWQLFVALLTLSTGFGLYHALQPVYGVSVAETEVLSLTETLRQVSVAARLYHVETSHMVPGRRGIAVLQKLGFLKRVPYNDFISVGGSPFQLLVMSDASDDEHGANVAVVNVGAAREICEAINLKEFGKKDIPVLPESAGSDMRKGIAGQTGCFRMHRFGLIGRPGPGAFVVFYVV